jgi:three-Cys-motif partner protein
LKEKFAHYIFVEKSAKKARDLSERLDREYPELTDRITVKCSDANVELQYFCKTTNWKKYRAVVFLDPFGNQVKWSTLEAIAQTEAIDLWYLFPAGLGVHRQIGKSGKVHHTHSDSLDMMLGTTKWRNAFLRDEQNAQGSLFEEAGSSTVKVATPDSITRFMIDRMNKIFKGGVLDTWLPLGSRGVHMYSLIFAWANPSDKAKLAGKLAGAVLRSGSRGRRK